MKAEQKARELLSLVLANMRSKACIGPLDQENVNAFAQALRDERREKDHNDFFVVALGAGDVLIQPCEKVVRAENGPQVQVDFFQHNRTHEIGAHSTAEEVKDHAPAFKYLGCIGSNSVASLTVLIEELTRVRDMLATELSQLGESR